MLESYYNRCILVPINQGAVLLSYRFGERQDWVFLGYDFKDRVRWAKERMSSKRGYRQEILVGILVGLTWRRATRAIPRVRTRRD